MGGVRDSVKTKKALEQDSIEVQNMKQKWGSTKILVSENPTDFEINCINLFQMSNWPFVCLTAVCYEQECV